MRSPAKLLLLLLLLLLFKGKSFAGWLSGQATLMATFGASHATSTMQPADVESQSAKLTSGMPVYDGSAMVKAGFIRKVYGILTIQLLFTGRWTPVR